MRKLRAVKWWHVLAAGVTVSVVGGLAADLLGILPFGAAASAYVGMGAVGGLAFWLVGLWRNEV
jgi:hypothetical protein